MFSTKQLSEDQISQIRQWAIGGAQLPDIQLQMKEVFSLSLTYMDTRFLALDLGLEIVEKKVEAPVEPQTPILTALGATGEISVTMDALPAAAALVSGKVIFSDGETGFWMIDENGRPGLDLSNPDYSPSQEDIMAFQTKLRALIQEAGM